MENKQKSEQLAYQYLGMLKEGYETGDFSKLFPFLAKDCAYASQWVFDSLTGCEEIADYLTEKGATLKKFQSFARCSIQELVVNVHQKENSAIHTGKLCLLMEQTVESKTSRVIVCIEMNDEGKIKRIDLCMPELYLCRPYQPD